MASRPRPRCPTTTVPVCRWNLEPYHWCNLVESLNVRACLSLGLGDGVAVRSFPRNFAPRIPEISRRIVVPYSRVTMKQPVRAGLPPACAAPGQLRTVSNAMLSGQGYTENVINEPYS